MKLNINREKSDEIASPEDYMQVTISAYFRNATLFKKFESDKFSLDYIPSSVRPGWSSGRLPLGQWNLRSSFAIGTSLIEA